MDKGRNVVTLTLQDLLARCRAGDGHAVAILVMRFRSWSLDLAEAMVDDAALAEDVVQEAFLTALERLGDLREPDAFPGWFRQILRTHAGRITRKRRELPLNVAVERPAERLANGPSPIEHLQRDELRQKVREALSALPETTRRTAELFYLEERTCADIGGLLGVPTGTVKRRLHDTRRLLRGMLLGYVGCDYEQQHDYEHPPPVHGGIEGGQDTGTITSTDT